MLAVGGMALLDADATDPPIDQLVASLIDGYGIPAEDAVDLPITGTPRKTRRAVRGLRRRRRDIGSS